jgi:hypothetical protein
MSVEYGVLRIDYLNRWYGYIVLHEDLYGVLRTMYSLLEYGAFGLRAENLLLPLSTTNRQPATSNRQSRATFSAHLITTPYNLLCGKVI